MRLLHNNLFLFCFFFRGENCELGLKTEVFPVFNTDGLCVMGKSFTNALNTMVDHLGLISATCHNPVSFNDARMKDKGFANSDTLVDVPRSFNNLILGGTGASTCIATKVKDDKGENIPLHICHELQGEGEMLALARKELQTRKESELTHDYIYKDQKVPEKLTGQLQTQTGGKVFGFSQLFETKKKHFVIRFDVFAGMNVDESFFRCYSNIWKSLKHKIDFDQIQPEFDHTQALSRDSRGPGCELFEHFA